MVEIVQGWQCIGCGKIDVPQDCVGVCQDRRVNLVYEADYISLLSAVEQKEKYVRVLEAIVHQLAWAKPHAGQVEKSFRELQQHALDALKSAKRA